MYVNLREVHEIEGAFDLYGEMEYGDRELRQAVPLVVREAFTLARFYPVIWRRMSLGLELVALRSLVPDGGPGMDRPVRPLLVEAFPFAAAETADAQHVLMIDQTAIPAYAGLPAFTAHGEASHEMQRRINALQVFLHDRAKTRALTQTLLSHDLLDPWDVDLTIDDQRVALTGLAIVTRDPGTRWHRLREAKLDGDIDLVRLLVAHDLSLFKMQELVHQHRTARVRVIDDAASFIAQAELHL
ncbi:SapC family protein [Methylobacterium sp. WL103]|uniref:SapC family protein n=1 Tax=Methylobacterium sp. WL103 TaxID=2603891 RepID=UPI0011CAC85A|nr:SapC family protein [Methylobacterium sp. WL103]TXN07163.1 SapC family protein [Methylobacterium sp. WL103]